MATATVDAAPVTKDPHQVLPLNENGRVLISRNAGRKVYHPADCRHHKNARPMRPIKMVHAELRGLRPCTEFTPRQA